MCSVRKLVRVIVAFRLSYLCACLLDDKQSGWELSAIDRVSHTGARQGAQWKSLSKSLLLFGYHNCLHVFLMIAMTFGFRKQSRATSHHSTLPAVLNGAKQYGTGSLRIIQKIVFFNFGALLALEAACWLCLEISRGHYEYQELLLSGCHTCVHVLDAKQSGWELRDIEFRIRVHGKVRGEKALYELLLLSGCHNCVHAFWMISCPVGW